MQEYFAVEIWDYLDIWKFENKFPENLEFELLHIWNASPGQKLDELRHHKRWYPGENLKQCMEQVSSVSESMPLRFSHMPCM